MSDYSAPVMDAVAKHLIGRHDQGDHSRGQHGISVDRLDTKDKAILGAGAGLAVGGAMAGYGALEQRKFNRVMERATENLNRGNRELGDLQEKLRQTGKTTGKDTSDLDDLLQDTFFRRHPSAGDLEGADDIVRRNLGLPSKRGTRFVQMSDGAKVDLRPGESAADAMARYNQKLQQDIDLSSYGAKGESAKENLEAAMRRKNFRVIRGDGGVKKIFGKRVTARDIYKEIQ